MTDPQSAPSKHCEQSRYYRDQASAIRARLPTLQDEEASTNSICLPLTTSGWRSSPTRPDHSGPSAT
jgi:hypothetical protein